LLERTLAFRLGSLSTISGKELTPLASYGYISLFPTPKGDGLSLPPSFFT
jgi:hypothetical protein